MQALDAFLFCALNGKKVLVLEEKRREGRCYREGTGPLMCLSLSLSVSTPSLGAPCPAPNLGPAVPILGGCFGRAVFWLLEC